MKTHEVHRFINSSSEFFTILKQLPSIDSDGPWVAGGSVWKSIENIPLECDVDIFFKSSTQIEQWYRKLMSIPYVHRIVSEPKSNYYNTSLKYHVSYGNYNKTIKLQLISFKFFDSIYALLDEFDFTACQFGFDGDKLYTGDTSFDDLRNREIVFNNILDCVATGIHIEKYLNFGFKISDRAKQKYEEIIEKRNNIDDDESVHESNNEYPRRTSNTGVNLSELFEFETPITAPSTANQCVDVNNLYQSLVNQTIVQVPNFETYYQSISGVSITPTNPCQEIPISPGVSTIEVSNGYGCVGVSSAPEQARTRTGEI